MPTTDDVAAEARTIVTGFEQRNISDPWFAAEAMIVSVAWLIGDLSRNETDCARHTATLRSILEACIHARFQATHATRN